jgi:hypothetical protein
MNRLQSIRNSADKPCDDPTRAKQLAFVRELIETIDVLAAAFVHERAKRITLDRVINRADKDYGLPTDMFTPSELAYMAIERAESDRLAQRLAELEEARRAKADAEEVKQWRLAYRRAAYQLATANEKR